MIEDIPPRQGAGKNLVVKLFSPWHENDLTYDGVIFSPGVDLGTADGVLAEYELREEIFSRSKPRAWYSWEPLCHSQYRAPMAKHVRREFGESEWLYFSNPNPAYRVPPITNCGGWIPIDNADRMRKVVSVVSNHGGRFWFLKRGVRLRNRFIMNSSVDLFGKESCWTNFSPNGPLGKRRTPANYRGEVIGNWMDHDHLRFMSGYKVAIAMENSIEPYYFTEKFVNAVRAGCIPVYAAHETVRTGILEGARWVDPIDFKLDPKATLEFALEQDSAVYQEANRVWLQKAAVIETHFDRVWRRLAAIFRRKIEEKGVCH